MHIHKVKVRLFLTGLVDERCEGTCAPNRKLTIPTICGSISELPSSGVNPSCAKGYLTGRCVVQRRVRWMLPPLRLSAAFDGSVLLAACARELG